MGEMETTKRCPQCEEVKGASEYWRRARSKDGRYSICKTCYYQKRNAKRRAKLGSYGNRAPAREYERQTRQKRKVRLLEHYGTKCSKCGFDDIRALSIDHIEGNGAEHRKEVPGGKLYGWLIRQHFPTGFQTLCMNCQFIKRHENNEWGNLLT